MAAAGLGLRAFLFAGLVAAAGSQGPPAETISSVERTLVTVISRDAGGAVRAESTGLLVSPEGHVVTSAHPFHGAGPTEIRTAEGTIYRVKAAEAESVTAELVRLAVEAPQGASFPHARLSETAPEAGARVTVVAGGRLLEGTVEAARSVSGLGTLLRVETSAGDDLTGAPLVDAAGQVAGIIVWPSRRRGAHVAVAADLAGSLHPRPANARGEMAACTGGAEQLYRDGVEWLITQDFDAARKDFERATAADPQCAPGWFHLGFALGKLGLTAERLEAYQTAVKVKPDFADARYSLGVVHALANRRAEALEEQRALEQLDRDLAVKLRMLIDAVTHDDPPAPAPTKPHLQI